MTLPDQCLAANKRWAASVNERDPGFFKRLEAQQSPELLWIGCSDSHLPPSEIMGLAPGEVFVHRNIANVVEHTDINCLSVLQYSVDVLKVKHIIVCGHYGCGGVRAAMQPKDLGILNPWLRNIRDVYRMHKAELDAIQNEALRYDRLVELTATEQYINVIKTAAVQQSYLTRGFPTVHAMVFDIRTGRLKDLGLDFRETLRNIQEVYDLTGTTWR